MKDFHFDNSNKKVKFNVYLNFITAFLVFVFYIIPVFPGFEGPPLSFIVFFFLYFGLFTLGLRYVHYQLLYAIFVVGFIAFILLFIYSIKFKQGRMINKVRKNVTYLFMQLPFSLGLLYFGIDVFREGTFYVYDSPINVPIAHHPYNMILAILILLINVFQIFHLYCILKRKPNFKSLGEGI